MKQFKLPLRTIFPIYTQRQSTLQCRQCFDFLPQVNPPVIIRRRMSDKHEPYRQDSVHRYKMSMDHVFLPENDDTSTTKPSKLGSLIENFCNSTSMHGCSQISGAKLTVVRFAWGFLTFAAVGVLMVHLWSIFDSYFKWPKQTKVSLGFSNLQYPAITLCNVNVLKKSALEGSEGMEKLKELVEFMDPDTLVPLSRYTGSGSNSTAGTTTTTTQSVTVIFQGIFSWNCLLFLHIKLLNLGLVWKQRICYQREQILTF